MRAFSEHAEASLTSSEQPPCSDHMRSSTFSLLYTMSIMGKAPTMKVQGYDFVKAMGKMRAESSNPIVTLRV